VGVFTYFFTELKIPFFHMTIAAKKAGISDKTLPLNLVNCKETELFAQMIDFEARLDATISRKTLDIQDQLQKPQRKSLRTLRIFMSNSCQTNLLDQTNSHNWTFAIQGRLLDVFLILICIGSKYP
jgi:SWI/SNF-related matrix-associated actin-dependent regulator of chromatin subfamily D